MSARMDGEDPGIADGEVYAHLAACGDCRAFAHAAEGLHREMRLTPAPEIPDLAPEILTAIGQAAIGGQAHADRPGRDEERVLRGILVVVALVQIAIAVPALILGSDAHLPVHAARHIGSFDVALGVGFLFAAWRPSRIAGFLPVVAALVACLAVSAVLDVAAGNTAVLGESQHVTDLAGLAVVWLLQRSAPAGAAARLWRTA